MLYPPAVTEDSNPTPLISFNEALQYFQTTDLGDLLVRNATYSNFSHKNRPFINGQVSNNSRECGLPPLI